MPREQFDKKIAAAKPITEPKVIAQLEEIRAKLDTSRPLSQWTDDELLAYAVYPDIGKTPADIPTTNPWVSVGIVVGIALGIPLVVLVLGTSPVWAFSGFRTKHT